MTTPEYKSRLALLGENPKLTPADRAKAAEIIGHRRITRKDKISIETLLQKYETHS